MTENELSKDQLESLFDACKPAWATIPDDMVGKVWAGGPRLKTCPFCGSAEVRIINQDIQSEYSIVCDGCHVWVDHMFDAMSMDEAIELWNRRVKE